jgi:hypothetical protein
MPGASSRIQDALLAALVTPRDPDRRRPVVAITGGWDSKSVTSVHLLDRVARRSDTVLQILAVRPDLTIDLQPRDVPARTWSNLDGFIRDIPTEQELKLFEGCRRSPAARIRARETGDSSHATSTWST